MFDVLVLSFPTDYTKTFYSISASMDIIWIETHARVCVCVWAQNSGQVDQTSRLHWSGIACVFPPQSKKKTSRILLYARCEYLMVFPIRSSVDVCMCSVCVSVRCAFAWSAHLCVCIPWVCVMCICTQNAPFGGVLFRCACNVGCVVCNLQWRQMLDWTVWYPRRCFQYTSIVDVVSVQRRIAYGSRAALPIRDGNLWLIIISVCNFLCRLFLNDGYRENASFC